MPQNLEVQVKTDLFVKSCGYNGCFIKKKINFEDQYMVHIAVLKKNRFTDYWEIRDQMVELRK